YEMMLSESQERMLMVLRPDKEEEAKAIFVKWGLDFAIVGKTTDDLRFRILHQGDEVANLPIKELGDQAPEYDRPWMPATAPSPLATNDIPQADVAEALLKLVGSANNSSRRWVYEQYDTLIQGNSLQLPGGDAGVVRVEGHETKALAFSSDVTPRYVEADPFEGGKQAVAECWRNLTATGALPLAATDNLNFGNPERPEIMSQFVHAIKGIGEACRVLEFPIVSGNVSLYNETNGQAILPTPTIGGVGLIKDWSKMARIRFAAADETILLAGAPESWGSHIAQSVYMRDIHGRTDGPAPHVDLPHERKAGDFVRGVIEVGLVTAVHDCSSGGLALAVAEMAMASAIGATVDAPAGHDPIPVFYGEDQGRYVVTATAGNLDAVLERAKAAGVSLAVIGKTGGDAVKLGDAKAVAIKDLRSVHESWFPDYMGGDLAPDN
ncbi:AIR synthase-related protein, partial [Sinorhizobium sp. 7-81]|uniref:AIR synthase-related protein n=1 Tax=Sinorhizobium sp. 8-89 TaxID=3049089 RepID=UPI0024C3A230